MPTVANYKLNTISQFCFYQCIGDYIELQYMESSCFCVLAMYDVSKVRNDREMTARDSVTDNFKTNEYHMQKTGLISYTILVRLFCPIGYSNFIY